MKTKKELKELFTSFKGLNKLKKIIENKECAGISCSKCPLGKDKLNGNIECLDIIVLSLYKLKEPETVETMNKLLDIFTEEKISKTLSLIDKRLKYNSKVIYNGNEHKIKGVLKKEFIRSNGNPILLNGFSNDYEPVCDDISNDYEPVCDDSICIIKDADTKKEYSLWVDVQDIEIK